MGLYFFILYDGKITKSIKKSIKNLHESIKATLAQAFLCQAFLCRSVLLCATSSRLSAMVENCASSSLSKSKLRHNRLKETKRKLFEASCKDNSLSMLYSQLTMLTYSIDCLTSYITGMQHGCKYTSTYYGGMCTSAPSATEPAEKKVDQTTLAHEEALQYPATCDVSEEIALSNTTAQDVSTIRSCASCWEPITICHCDADIRCRYCSGLGSHRGTVVNMDDDPPEPKRPPSAYFVFAMHCKRAGNRHDINFQWSNLADEGRKPFHDLAFDLKSMYDEQMAEWRQRGRHSGHAFTEDYVLDRLSAYLECLSSCVEQNIWSEEETIQWYKTTCRVVQEQSSLEACLTTMATRWDQAESFLPSSVKDIISEGLAEMEESLTTKFLQHQERMRSRE